MFARFQELRAGDGVPEHWRYFRHERAQVDEARKLPYIAYDTAGGAQDGAGSTTKPSGTTTTPATLAFAVGDVVRFTGNTHYTNAAAASGAACKPGTAKVTALAKGAKAPLPPYQTARRRFYRLRLGQCGGRAGRRERVRPRRKCASVQR